MRRSSTSTATVRRRGHCHCTAPVVILTIARRCRPAAHRWRRRPSSCPRARRRHRSRPPGRPTSPEARTRQRSTTRREAAIEQVLIALGPGGQHLRRDGARLGHVAELALERRRAALDVGQVLDVAHVDADADHHELRRPAPRRDPRPARRPACGRRRDRWAISATPRARSPGRYLRPRQRPPPGSASPNRLGSPSATGSHRRPHHGREVEPGVGRRRPAPATAAAAGGLMTGDHDQAVRSAGVGQRRRPVHRRRHRRRRTSTVGDVTAEARSRGVERVGERGGQRLGRHHGSRSGRQRHDLEAEVHRRRRMRRARPPTPHRRRSSRSPAGGRASRRPRSRAGPAPRSARTARRMS